MPCGWMTTETLLGHVQPVKDTPAVRLGLTGKTREAKQHTPKTKLPSKNVNVQLKGGGRKALI